LKHVFQNIAREFGLEFSNSWQVCFRLSRAW